MTLLCGQSLNLHGKSTHFLLILYHRWTKFEMLALKQSAKKWLFSAIIFTS